MNFDKLKKDKRIIKILKFLADKYGDKSFKINDYWDGDLIAIGLTDNSERNLLYFAINQTDNSFYISVENQSETEYKNLIEEEAKKLLVEYLIL